MQQEITKRNKQNTQYKENKQWIRHEDQNGGPNSKHQHVKTKCMAKTSTCNHVTEREWFSWKWRTIKNWIWNLRKTSLTDLETCLKIRLFLSFQIRWTRRARATRLILWCNPLRLPERPLIAPEREDIDRLSQSHYLIRLYRNEVQSQLKNRWAWDKFKHCCKDIWLHH